jgi:hypothetical protein
MELKPMETLYILTRSDVDRVDAAVGLLRQALEDLIEARAVRVSKEPHSPGALYELSDEAAQIHEERRYIEDEF